MRWRRGRFGAGCWVAVGMQGGAVVMLPYLLIIGLCVSQFVRPTLLGWFVLTAAFGSYTAGIAANLPHHKSVLALLLTALPTAFLLLAWPKPFGKERSIERG